MNRHLAGKEYRLEQVFADTFETTDNWRCEGIGAKLWTSDGWLYCDAQAGDVHAATIWCAAAQFADPLWLEFDVRFLAGQFNGNLILHAIAAGNADILTTSDTRRGDYHEYHTFPNYIVTFLNDGTATRVRYRRNPGFTLLGETFYEPALQLDRMYHVNLLLQAGYLQFYVDGRLQYEMTDPDPPLTAGRFAFRTWQTALCWSNLKVCRIMHGQS